jgi:hypothetical protein
VSEIWSRKSDGCDEDCESDGANEICHAGWGQYVASVVTDERSDCEESMKVTLMMEGR